jgi:hypothetical protein
MLQGYRILSQGCETMLQGYGILSQGCETMLQGYEILSQDCETLLQGYGILSQPCETPFPTRELSKNKKYKLLNFNHYENHKNPHHQPPQR